MKSLFAAALLAGLVLGCRDAKPAFVPADVGNLRAAFNAGERGPRLVVFFSSACRACDEGSTLLDAMLRKLPGDLRVFAVWEPIDASDGPPPPAWLDNLTDARVTQVWDPTHVMSAELRNAEIAHPSSPPQARLRMAGRDDGILYDTAVLFPPRARWEETLPAPVYVDGGLARVLPTLADRIEQLLARE